MSGRDEEEPMEVDGSQKEPPASDDANAAVGLLSDVFTGVRESNEEGVQVTFSVQWLEGFQQQNKDKNKRELEKLLQTWANKENKGKTSWDLRVSDVHEDGSAVVTFKPASAQSELKKLNGKEVNRDGKTVKILSVSFPTPEVKTPAPEDASINLLPSFVSEQHGKEMQPPVQPSAVWTTAREEDVRCFVPVNHFWYLNHIYKEDIKRIEKQNGVKIMADVNVTFQGDQKDGSPQKALSEYISLVQKCLGESSGSIIPLKKVNPEDWKDAVKIIQRKENKILLTVSSEEIYVCGPSRDVVRKSLTATTHTGTYDGESAWPPNIGKGIKDPLVEAGLTMEKSFWELMITSCGDQVAEIKTKFNVDFKESFNQGKVNVKASSKTYEGNASMESHAARALLHLYQKFATSLSFIPHNGAIGFIEGASGGRGLDVQSDSGAATAGGATAGDPAQEDNCSICIDKFINKKRLKCKHEFCAECLEKSRQSRGPKCPLCNDIFGLIEGDQPAGGTMTWRPDSSSLPGFPGYGSIIITYYIPGGKQTQKHSNPGKHYSGITRTAYLPDNKEGNEVRMLLKKAFDQRLIFTVGTSRTSGVDNLVTWNDIHHKTRTTGGIQNFGYPDDGYLGRVKEELKAAGIV
ncbi:E3 ubiquitin-protein ligase DTX3L [Liparis tanakae]|uniref:E3 ubiquitin-protein ligase n=1 Tax=Liparis tanakae TaxID=230148 RepID=A0A4Z2ITM8_9TELE|nr:E3 ubiquitin-protein ligase DTX3L [Liparis tanakae]